MKRILKLTNKNKTSAGFTLLELIIAATFSVFVIGAAGFGLMNMLKGNQKSAVQVDRRTEVNRGVEFVSDEIRKAETIELDPNQAFNDANIDDDNAQPILALNIPGVVSPVIYYLSSPKSGEVWQGKVLYRHGPPIDSSGNYTAANWQQEALIDNLSDDVISHTCDNSWTLSPQNNVKGFYACIDSDGKTAEIFAVSEIKNGETYKANTTTYARADRNPLDPNLTIATYDPSCELIAGGAINCSGGGKMRVDTVANLFGCDKFNNNWTTEPSVYVGGIKQTLSSNEVDLSSGDNEIHFVGETDDSSCSSSDNYASQDLQNIKNVVSKYIIPNDPDDEYHPWATRFLKDGDTLPGMESWNGDAVPTGNEHESLKNQLENYTRQDGTKIVENGVITLKENEYLLAFEIGQIQAIIDEAPAFNPDLDPTTDDVGDYLEAHPTPETIEEITNVGLPPGADWQDLVLLITLPE